MKKVWPKGCYDGAVIDVGHDDAMRLLEEVPAARRLYTFEEVLGMVDALGSLPESRGEWVDWIDGHVEHMAFGGYVIGRPLT